MQKMSLDRQDADNSSGLTEAEGTFTVVNDRGLHTRPATELVKCASRYKSLILLRSHGMEVNAKSLLGILTLSATKGTKIRIHATGVDAQLAVDAVRELAANRFNIDY